MRFFYMALMRTLFQRILIPRFASAERISEARNQWKAAFSGSSAQNVTGRKRIWWHAASVGELEILWPVMIRLAEQAQKVGNLTPEFVITILSDSAQDRLGKLVQALEKHGVKPVFAGYSPWEGNWGPALRFLKPDLFVTSKYEAWPELWMALGDLGIPLSIVSAKNRRSLKICRAVCRALGARLPRMSFLTATVDDIAGLKTAFPNARIEKVGEPRWDQVWSRAQAGNARVKEIASALAVLPRPWGVLGSAWEEDVALWKGLLPGLKGSVLIVPHRVDAEHVGQIEEILEGAGIVYLKTADFASAEDLKQAWAARPGIRCVLINEMGFLSEFYAVADWAYIGGGIGRRGVHSTIEPALHGIPVCCGPYRAHQFVEIGELSATGQLTIVRNEEEAHRWSVGLLPDASRRERWKSEAQARLGATERIIEALRTCYS